MTLTSIAVASKVSQAEKENVNDHLLEHFLDTTTLRATVFDDLLARNEVVAAFALPIGKCIGPLGVTLEAITVDSSHNTEPNAGRNEQGAAALVAAEEPLQRDT